MSFSDIKFVLYFLPAFLVVYSLIPLKLRGIVLLVGSIVFYALGAGIEISILILIMVLVNYLGGLWISSCSNQGRKAVLALFLVIDFGCLIYYKYMGFFIREISGLTGIQSEWMLSIVPVILPLGISFMVFQFASYLIDVYRSTIYREKNIIIFANYNLAFPKVLMGPICRMGEMRPGLAEPKIDWKSFEKGLSLFIVGLAFKVIIADRLSPVWMDIQKIGYDSITTGYAWYGVVCYSLQLYFDFSGYSMMAMGLGTMIGISIPRNFDLPYISRSVSEFFRRWHMTLGRWFRDYIYIPMGGNRKGTAATIFNLAVVWLITGLWHGDNRNFLLWGIYLFIFIVLEKYVIGGFLKNHNVISHIYTVFVILMSWVIFAITDIKEIGIYFSRLFPIVPTENTVFENDFLFGLKSCWWAVLLGIFFCLPFGRKLYERFVDKVWFKIALMIVFWIALFMELGNTGNPFMYMQF